MDFVLQFMAAYVLRWPHEINHRYDFPTAS